MAEYSEDQSRIIALWVLAIKNRGHPNGQSVKGGVAPEVIVNLVNQLGEYHSPQSILLHTHGYDRLLLNRDIDKTITKLQRRVAKELKEQGVVNQIYL